MIVVVYPRNVSPTQVTFVVYSGNDSLGYRDTISLDSNCDRASDLCFATVCRCFSLLLNPLLDTSIERKSSVDGCYRIRSLV